MHPFAISTILMTELSLTLGMLILSSGESLRATSLSPERADLTASGALSIELGPIRLADELTDSIFALSAFGRQPATTSGLPDLNIVFILLIILCSVVSLTEHVTIRLRALSLLLVAISYPASFNIPDIISESAMLAEQPYASIHTLGLGFVSNGIVSMIGGLSDT